MKNKVTGIIPGIVLLLASVSGVQAQGNTRIVNLLVNGMTSPTCPVLLKSAVKNIQGVKSVQASLENHSATIEFDEEQTSLEKIQDTIEASVGFSTKLK